MKGRLADGRLMVVGRAVNGWVTRFTAGAVADAEQRAEIRQRTVRRSNLADRCPMSWVEDAWGRIAEEGYNTRRSQFWKTIRGVLGNTGLYDISRTDWPSSVIWSNLYKVSLARGGNPTTKLMRLQKPICYRQLAAEVDLWQPQRILFLTGLNWCRSFLTELGAEPPQSRADGLVHWAGTLKRIDHQTSIVVAAHPQGKRIATLVDEIGEAFRAIS